MNARVATVLNPKRLATAGSLSLTNQTRKIAERNFEVQIKTEFQFDPPLAGECLLSATYPYRLLSRSCFLPRPWRREGMSRDNL
jgi:hypothetical protein